MKSLLVRLIGFRATLIHGDTLVLDRWLWLRRCLPRTRNNEKVLDVGCGTGAFSIGAALKGYASLGLSWDERNRRVAKERAVICRANAAEFEVFDVRNLSERTALKGEFDLVICCENIEHIIDDLRLMRAMSACLKPGGRLFLTAPNLDYIPMGSGDIGPFYSIEDGGHVRKGYTPTMLRELCEHAGLTCEQISYCSGFLSQKITAFRNIFARIHPALGWIVILPFRALPPIFDDVVTRLLRWPKYSICMKAQKPRFSSKGEHH